MAINAREFLFKYLGDASSLKAASSEAEAALRKTQGSASDLEDSLSVFGRGTAFASGAVVAGAAAIGAALFSASAQAQNLRLTLGAVTGGNGAEQLEALRDTANRLGLDMSQTAQAFTSFQAAARGTSLEGKASQQIFESVARSAKALGASGENTTGSLLALQQMLSKGVVSAEELRGQLGERMPGAFQIAARAMGVTTAELGKMLERGEVLSVDFLPRFARQLEMELGGAADEAAKSMESSSLRMKNAFLELKTVLGDTGIAQGMADAMEGLARSMNSVSEAINRVKAAGGGGVAQIAAGANQAGLNALRNLSGPSLPFIGPAGGSPFAAPLTVGAAALNRAINPVTEQQTQLAFESSMSSLMGAYGSRSSGFQQAEEREQALTAARTKFMAQYRQDGDRLADEIRAYVKQFAGKVAPAEMERDIAAIRAKSAGVARPGRAPAAARTSDAFARTQDSLEARIRDRLEGIAESEVRADESELEKARRTLDQLLSSTNIGKARELNEQLALLRGEFERTGGEDSSGQVGQAIFQVEKQLRDLEPVAQQSFEKMSVFAEQAARNIQDGLGDTIEMTLSGNFQNIGKMWGQLLTRMLAQAAATKLNEALFGQGGNAGNALMQFLGAALGTVGSGKGMGMPGAMDPFRPVGGASTGTNMLERDMITLVHKGEAIVPKAYNPAAGGARVTVNNYSGSEVQTRQRDDGGLDIDILTRAVEQRMAGNVAGARGPMAGALKARGLNSSPSLARMG